jgi:hypothetical protein
MLKINDERNNFENLNNLNNLNEETVKLNFKKRLSEPFVNNFEIGSLNYDTPISYFLKTYYYKDLSSYIYHKEILINNNNETNFIFILMDDILITNKFEDENNINNYNYADSSPILMKIEYKMVIIIKIINEI